VRDLSSRVFVAWRSRLTHRRLALFRRRDVHARRIRADAATTLADDGRSGGGQRDATVRDKYGVRVRGDAGVLVNARQVRDLQPRLTRIDRQAAANGVCNCTRKVRRSSAAVATSREGHRSARPASDTPLRCLKQKRADRCEGQHALARQCEGSFRRRVYDGVAPRREEHRKPQLSREAPHRRWVRGQRRAADREFRPWDGPWCEY